MLNSFKQWRTRRKQDKHDILELTQKYGHDNMQDHSGTALTYAFIMAMMMLIMLGWLTFAISSESWCKQLYTGEALEAGLEHAHTDFNAAILCQQILLRQLTTVSWSVYGFIFIFGMSLLGIFYVRHGGGGFTITKNSDGSFSASGGKSKDVFEGVGSDKIDPEIKEVPSSDFEEFPDEERS